MSDMTMRDQFAMAAIPAFVSGALKAEATTETLERVAEWSYALADAMMKARQAQGEGK